MNNSSLVYSTESGKICPSCQKPVSKCTCKKKKPRSQTNIKYDGIIRIQREVKGRKGKTVTTLSGFQFTDAELKKPCHPAKTPLRDWWIGERRR